MSFTPSSSHGGGGTAVIDTATVPVTAAQIKNLFTVFRTLVAAPGANKMILPLAVTIALDFATTAYTDPLAADIQVVWEPGTITAWDCLLGPFMQAQDCITPMVGNLSGQPTGVTFATAVVNKALQLANFGGGDLATGDSPITVTTKYVTVDTP